MESKKVYPLSFSSSLRESETQKKKKKKSSSLSFSFTDGTQRTERTLGDARKLSKRATAGGSKFVSWRWCRLYTHTHVYSGGVRETTPSRIDSDGRCASASPLLYALDALSRLDHHTVATFSLYYIRYTRCARKRKREKESSYFFVSFKFQIQDIRASARPTNSLYTQQQSATIMERRATVQKVDNADFFFPSSLLYLFCFFFFHESSNHSCIRTRFLRVFSFV